MEDCSCFTGKHAEIKRKLENSPDYRRAVEDMSKMFSLLGDASRMKILLALKEGELCVYRICETIGGKQSAVSQHLRKLKDGNLVKSRKDGNQVLYSLSDEHVVSIINMAIQHRHC
ncbi:MAG: winged helix-turn-helix transcriptional regulator [Clostridia bacterium]|nr:winged helix-turn-helix transcriptional regulator [Clostridia bacterium]